MGSPAAKELLPDAYGQPLIQWALELAANRDWKAHVITRDSKQPLLEYLEKRKQAGLKLSIQLIEDSTEWPDTLLQSQPYWDDQNLVILPDTRFEPTTVLDELQETLARGADAAFALFDTPEFATWGVIDPKQRRLCEKPQEDAQALLAKGCKAWGAFGFQKNAGTELLSQMLASTFDHTWKTLPPRSQFVNLLTFEDLTRKLVASGPTDRCNRAPAEAP